MAALDQYSEQLLNTRVSAEELRNAIRDDEETVTAMAKRGIQISCLADAPQGTDVEENCQKYFALLERTIRNLLQRNKSFSFSETDDFFAFLKRVARIARDAGYAGKSTLNLACRVAEFLVERQAATFIEELREDTRDALHRAIGVEVAFDPERQAELSDADDFLREVRERYASSLSEEGIPDELIEHFLEKKDSSQEQAAFLTAYAMDHLYVCMMQRSLP